YMIFDAPPEHRYGAPSPSLRPAAMAAGGDAHQQVLSQAIHSIQPANHHAQHPTSTATIDSTAIRPSAANNPPAPFTARWPNSPSQIRWQIQQPMVDLNSIQ
ncbi:hypothetical protein ACLOJK_024091, partial [Asimina triloba]